MCMGEWRVINEQKVAASESRQERLVARNESIPPQTEQTAARQQATWEAHDMLPTLHLKG